MAEEVDFGLLQEPRNHRWCTFIKALGYRRLSSGLLVIMCTCEGTFKGSKMTDLEYPSRPVSGAPTNLARDPVSLKRSKTRLLRDHVRR
jgi:hypothetical protein